MIIVLSPSKRQDFESKIKIQETSKLRLKDKTLKLVDELKKYDPEKLAKLMKISEDLSILNFQRYQKFQANFTNQNAKPAIYAFKGDVYRDIEAESYTKDEINFAQKHLRTLSGLYGLLRPLDLIQPYRLEMKTKLKVDKSENLYEFWGDDITKLLNEDLKNAKSKYLINLASEEYFKSINEKQLNAKVINIVFKEKKLNKDPQIIAIYSKIARGTMANYIIKNKITDPEDLKKFNIDNYIFDAKSSNKDELTFIRSS